MYKKSGITLLILIFCLTWDHLVYSQDQGVIDSLTTCIKTAKTDTGKIYLTIDICKKYINNNPSKAKYYIDEAIRLSEKTNFKKGIATSLQVNGNIYFTQGDYFDAMEKYNKSLSLAIELGDRNLSSKCLNNIGLIYRLQCNYIKAIEYFEKALKIAEELGDKNNMSLFSMNIGVVYRNQSNYIKAIEYYEKSLKIAEELGNKQNLSSCLTNIGVIHFNQENYTKAKKYFEKSLKINEELGDQSGITLCLNNLGGICLALNEDDKAKEYIDKASSLSKKMGDKRNISYSIFLQGKYFYEKGDNYLALKQFKKARIMYKELGDLNNISEVDIEIGLICYEMGDYETAIRCGLEGLNLSQKIGVKQNIAFGYELMSNSYAKLKKFEKAYQYYILFKKIQDSIFSLESKQKILEVEANLEHERNENKIKMQKILIGKKDVEIRQRQIRENALIGGYLAVIIILVLVLYLIRVSHQKKEHKLKEALYLNMQKTLGQQMNPHFIFNTLNSIQYYICKNMSKESMIYLSKFANLMRKILYNSQNYTVPLKEEIELLKSYCELEALRLENRFDFKIDIDKNINSNVYKIPVFLLQPLIENAIKHGIESIDNNGIISLKVMEHNGGLKCRIEDNGIGNSAVPNLNKKDEHLSLAGKLIQKRLDILSMYYKKKFEFIMKDIKTESGDVLGFVSEITLPIIE